MKEAPVPTILLVEGAHYNALMAKSPREYLYLPVKRNAKAVHISRDPAADMDLCFDDGVSRRHLRIIWDATGADGAGCFIASEVADKSKPGGQQWPSAGTWVPTDLGWQRLVPGGNVILNNRDELRLGPSSVIVMLDEDFPVIPTAASRDQIERIHAERKAAGLRDGRSASRPSRGNRHPTVAP